MRFSVSASLLAVAAIVATCNAAALNVSNSSLKRCTNSASNRKCWGNYDITTDYENVVPETGVTREYWFEVVNSTAAPDGVPRMVLSVNGSVPGPTIEANWGDHVVVHVTNKLANNGTGIHFHGVRQNYTNQNDGTPSITQCPTAPGETYTYKWRATQYGTSWYHSHYSLQAWEGVFGGIVIHGPASSNYDEDLGSLFLGDWSHTTFSTLYFKEATIGPPTLDNGLINGTGVWGNVGSRFETTFKAGKSYRLRLVNSAIDTHYKFSIDNHKLKVIAMDFVPIVPFTTDMLSVGIGERYDVVVEANQHPGDYWLRAIQQESCSHINTTAAANVKGIVRYHASSTANPTTSAYKYHDDCDDVPMSQLVPYVAKDVGQQQMDGGDFEITVDKVGNFYKWFLNDFTMKVELADPTLLQISEKRENWTSQDAVVEVDGKNEWVYLVIETDAADAHPMHLHGHDFYVLAQGNGTYADVKPKLARKNPPRRDVAMLPGYGFLVIAFYTDNPGVWLMHCHIGWHAEEGLSLQFVERPSEIPALVDKNALQHTCSGWNAYTKKTGFVMGAEDSGV